MKTLAYIDGTNLLTELAKHCSLPFKPEKVPDPVLKYAAWLIHNAYRYEAAARPYRYYWFGSYQGNEEDENRIRFTLRENGVEATLFRRREAREKGVDISLTKEMLVNAFNRNCERSVLFAGDEDYVTLVNEVKRYGQLVKGHFFRDSSSPHLIASLDQFEDLSNNIRFVDAKEKLAECRSSLPAKAAQRL